MAYQQALLDLATPDRLSWRGPATDLREALRETLDVLAPDDEAKAMPGFKLEGEHLHPHGHKQEGGRHGAELGAHGPVRTAGDPL